MVESYADIDSLAVIATTTTATVGEPAFFVQPGIVFIVTTYTIRLSLRRVLMPFSLRFCLKHLFEQELQPGANHLRDEILFVDS